jgi:hydrogenase nickel incorporation protein HypB
MCDTCGCGGPEDQVKITKPGEDIHEHEHHHHDHEHPHKHEHHSHDHDHTHNHNERIVKVEQDILGKNNLLASRNMGYFEAKNILVMNLMSSPGSGKTTLLEKTIAKLKLKKEVAVVEGDQQTMNDAMRIEASGAPVVQVNTGNGCHLDAEMILNATKKLELKENSVLFIENVGNLVCPSLFELGEKFRVVIISVTEGEDKPQKYPTMFENADLCIINKTDLLPYVDFSVDKCKEYASTVNPKLTFIELSAKTGEGMDQWINWILEEK